MIGKWSVVIEKKYFESMRCACFLLYGSFAKQCLWRDYRKWK